MTDTAARPHQMRSAGTPLLEVNDLSVTFPTPAGRLTAVDGVSVTVNKGRAMGLVGESGSGKTVFSRTALGLLSGRSAEKTGSVKFAGEELLDNRKRHRELLGTEMAMVFQDPATALNPVVSIGRHITLGLRRNLGLSKNDAKERAIELLRSVGIPEPESRVDRHPHELSGGMRQRVVIAMALACSPELLFADEPTTALDVTVQSKVLELLDTARTEREMTLVLVSHDLTVVAGRTDDLVVMYAGRVAERGPTNVVFNNPKMPYTEALLSAAPRLDGRRGERLRVIPGSPPDLVSAPDGCRFAPRCAYAQDKCRNERPPEVAGDQPGHAYACWTPVGSPEADASLEKNIDAGLPAALALTQVLETL